MTDLEREEPQGAPRDDATRATVTSIDAVAGRIDRASRAEPGETSPWGELDGPFGWDPLDAA